MKKVFILLILTLLLTGCYNIKNLSIDQLINVNIEEKSIKSNTFVEGYKFYKPVGMTLSNDLHSNNILYSLKDKYYLYVDIVSYNNKTINDYELTETSNTYYMNKISYKDKSGYVLINEIDNRYLLEIMYNYAKIEVVTDDVKTALTNSLIILKSIEYNDKIVKTLIEDNGLSYDEETFNLLGPNVYTDNFLQYIEDYGSYEEDNVDEDTLDLDITD